jgi:hypothetical protein
MNKASDSDNNPPLPVLGMDRLTTSKYALTIPLVLTIIAFVSFVFWFSVSPRKLYAVFGDRTGDIVYSIILIIGIVPTSITSIIISARRRQTWKDRISFCCSLMLFVTFVALMVYGLFYL